MAVAQQVIEHLDEVDTVLRASAPAVAAPLVLVVPIVEVAPPWLAEAVVRAHASGATLVVSLEPTSPGVDDRAAGWEIGVITAALAAGADDVLGTSPERVARVGEVLRRLADAGREVAR